MLRIRLGTLSRKIPVLVFLLMAASTVAQAQTSTQKDDRYILFLKYPLAYNPQKLPLNTRAGGITKTHIRVLPIQLTTSGQPDPSSILFQAIKSTLANEVVNPIEAQVSFLESANHPVVNGSIQLGVLERHQLFLEFISNILDRYSAPSVWSSVAAIKTSKSYAEFFLPQLPAKVDSVNQIFAKLKLESQSFISTFSNPARINKNFTHLNEGIVKIVALLEVYHALKEPRQDQTAGLFIVGELAKSFGELFMDLHRIDYSLLRGFRASGTSSLNERQAFKEQLIGKISSVLKSAQNNSSDEILEKALEMLQKNLMQKPEPYFTGLAIANPLQWIDAILRVSVFDGIDREETGIKQSFLHAFVLSHRSQSASCSFELQD